MILNLLQVFGLLIVVLQSDSHGHDWPLKDSLIFLFLIAVPGVTMPLLYDLETKHSWFGLFLKRKRLEEMEKIDSMKKQDA